MNIKDFTRLIQPIKKKIFLLLGRAILTAVNNAEKTQKIQVTVLKDETITDVEKFENYGFYSYPVSGNAESIIAFLDGNRDLGIALMVHDRDARPTDLAEKDIQMKDLWGNTIKFTTNGIVIEDLNSNKVEMKSGEINITGTKINLLNATEAYVNGTTFDTWITGTLKTIFDAHVHPGVTAGGASTAITVTPLTAPAGHLSTTIKGS